MVGEDFSTTKEHVYFTLGPEYVVIKVITKIVRPEYVCGHKGVQFS